MALKGDNGAIQAAQRFGLSELLLYAHKQLQRAEEVYAVYEAGPLGYALYRQLKELGIKAYVSAPECLEQNARLISWTHVSWPAGSTATCKAIKR